MLKGFDMNKSYIWGITIVGFFLVTAALVSKDSKPQQNHNSVQLWRMKDPDRPFKGYFDPSRKLFVTCSGSFLDMTEDQLEKEYGSCKK